MDQLKIAIFGSSGAIGSALCRKYIQQENVKKVYCFSRKKTAKLSLSEYIATKIFKPFTSALPEF